MTDHAATTIRLGPDLMDRLRVAALVCDRPASRIIREAVSEHLLALEKSPEYKRRRAALIIATTPVEAETRARRTKLAAAAPVPPAEEGNL